MDSKIAIVIVLYNPDYRNVSNNINCLALSDKRVAILNNGFILFVMERI